MIKTKWNNLCFKENRFKMFNIFKKKSEKEKLMEKYAQLMEESFKLSKTNRKESDAKTAEAMEIMSQIESIID